MVKDNKDNKDINIYPNSAFSENNIPIVFASNDGFAYFVSIAIQSIISNAAGHNNYDIFILDDGISSDNKAIIEKIMHNNANFQLSYIDMQPYLKDVDVSLLERTCGHYSLATWFRIFIPRIFKSFEKVIYLDCDIVLLTDIAELFHTDMQGHVLAACREYAMTAQDCKYYTEVLGLKNASNYFNSGVLLFKGGEILNNSLEDNCLKELIKFEKPICPDQDILNIVCENDVKYLDGVWNIMWMREAAINSLSPDVKAEIMKFYAAPKLVHYAGVKPINTIGCDLGQYFWKYAAQIPLYELCQQHLLDYLIQRMQAEDTSMGKDPKRDMLKKTLWKYLILSKISFGDEKIKYLNAYNEYATICERMQP